MTEKEKEQQVSKQPETNAQASGKESAKDNKKAKKPRKKTDIFTILFLVCCGVLVLLVFVIEWQKMQYTDYLVKQEALVASFPGETEVTQEKVSALDSGFLEDQDVIDFIETVEQSRSSFDQFDIKFISDVPEGSKQPFYLPVTFTLVGSYENIELFMQSLFDAPYVIRVKNIQFESEDGFRNTMKLTLTAELFISEKYGK